MTDTFDDGCPAVFSDDGCTPEHSPGTNPRCSYAPAADPMVPDEAVEAAKSILARPLIGLDLDHYVRAALAAAMPALTAAARAEVAASVGAVLKRLETLNVDHRHEGEQGAASPFGIDGRAYYYAGDIVDLIYEFRAAVSDDGIVTHNQQMRAEGAREVAASVKAMAERLDDKWSDQGDDDHYRRGDDLLEAIAHDSTLNLTELGWALGIEDDADAEAVGDQHHHGGDE